MGPLGILGGGQLARMTLQAASRLGIDVVIAERFVDSPAARLTCSSLVFEHGWDDVAPLRELAARAPVVTLESEFVDWRVLERLESLGTRVLPSPACVRVVQDKLLQKEALARAELPVPPFREITTIESAIEAGTAFGWPLMLKGRRDGYDGHGNAVARYAQDVEAKMRMLGWPERALFAEALVRFVRELASLVVRSPEGKTVQYPVVETRQDPMLHICREVIAPAALDESVAKRAAQIARSAVEAVDGVGAFGVEMFLLADGQVVINELAPRPHNSAHYTIEACWTSQFENHVRAVLGLPLGSTELRAPAAVMVNLLGTNNDRPQDDVLKDALTEPDAFVHLYGKRENRPGRKMGHVTSLGATTAEALTHARAAAARVHL